MRADEIQWITADAAVWEAYDPAVKCDLSSAALRLAGERLVLIDPIPLAEPAIEELAGAARPALIILTNGNHERAALMYRNRWDIPVAAHAGAMAELALDPDEILADGDVLLDELEVTAVPGAGPGEIAVLFRREEILCVGDALIHLPPKGLEMLPAKYCRNAELLPHSLRKLLRFEFRVLTFAHGSPIAAAARSQLEALLA